MTNEVSIITMRRCGHLVGLMVVCLLTFPAETAESHLENIQHQSQLEDHRSKAADPDIHSSSGQDPNSQQDKIDPSKAITTDHIAGHTLHLSYGSSIQPITEELKTLEHFPKPLSADTVDCTDRSEKSRCEQLRAELLLEEISVKTHQLEKPDAWLKLQVPDTAWWKLKVQDMTELNLNVEKLLKPVHQVRIPGKDEQFSPVLSATASESEFHAPSFGMFVCLMHRLL